MDSVFGSPKLSRKPLTINPRRSIKKEFGFNSNVGFKSKASPSVVTWGSRGRGVQGESVNSTNNASNQIVNRGWKPT